jgi:hypothetical protein
LMDSAVEFVAVDKRRWQFFLKTNWPDLLRCRRRCRRLPTR